MSFEQCARDGCPGVSISSKYRYCHALCRYLAGTLERVSSDLRQCRRDPVRVAELGRELEALSVVAQGVSDWRAVAAVQG
jgi:hypothetical protein